MKRIANWKAGGLGFVAAIALWIAGVPVLAQRTGGMHVAETCESCHPQDVIASAAPAQVATVSTQAQGGGSSLGVLFDTTGFPARWNCGTAWTPLHGYIHIISDIAIWGAYMAIPAAMFFFLRGRTDIPFTRIWILYILFIAACGTGHLVEAGIFWWPAYRLSAAVKVITAVVSWFTVLSLLRILPTALALPGLAAMAQTLQEEVKERTEAQKRATAHAAELERFHKIAVDREMRIVELKEQVNTLARQIGKSEPYDLKFILHDAHSKS